jgi:hypothetical protein
MSISHTIEVISPAEQKMQLAGGYSLLSFDLDICSKEGGHSMLLCNPAGEHLFVALDTDAYVRPQAVVEGIERKIVGVEKHLQDLKTALRVITEGDKTNAE